MLRKYRALIGIFTASIVALFLALTMTAVASAAPFPQWGKVTANDGVQTATSFDPPCIFLDAFGNEYTNPSLIDYSYCYELPTDGSSWEYMTTTIKARSPVINNDKPFVLATDYTRVDFKLLRRGYTQRIYRDKDFDNFWNICILQGRPIRASGETCTARWCTRGSFASDRGRGSPIGAGRSCSRRPILVPSTRFVLRELRRRRQIRPEW